MTFKFDCRVQTVNSWILRLKLSFTQGSGYYGHYVHLQGGRYKLFARLAGCRYNGFGIQITHIISTYRRRKHYYYLNSRGYEMSTRARALQQNRVFYNTYVQCSARIPYWELVDRAHGIRGRALQIQLCTIKSI